MYDFGAELKPYQSHYCYLDAVTPLLMVGLVAGLFEVELREKEFGDAMRYILGDSKPRPKVVVEVEKADVLKKDLALSSSSDSSSSDSDSSDDSSGSSTTINSEEIDRMLSLTPPRSPGADVGPASPGDVLEVGLADGDRLSESSGESHVPAKAAKTETGRVARPPLPSTRPPPSAPASGPAKRPPPPAATKRPSTSTGSRPPPASRRTPSAGTRPPPPSAPRHLPPTEARPPPSASSGRPRPVKERLGTSGSRPVWTRLGLGDSSADEEVRAAAPPKPKGRAYDGQWLDMQNQRRENPTHGGRCAGCGEVGHSRFSPQDGSLQCKEFVGLKERYWRSRCAYEMCRATLPHTTTVCPSLHGMCRRCYRRGHQDSVLCRSKTAEEFKASYERNRHLGRLTRRPGYEFRVYDPIMERRGRPSGQDRRDGTGRKIQLV